MGSLLFAAALATPAGAQQPALTNVRVDVEVLEEGPADLVARVQVDYGLRVDPATTELPLRALRFSGARPENVRASVDGIDIPVHIRPAGATLLKGVVLLPRRDSAHLRLRLEYRVIERLHEDAYRVTVPLLLPQGIPGGTPDDFFVARLRLPDGHVIVEAFPTLPPSMPGGADVGRVVQLQVVPAMLRWRARIGEPPLLRFGRIIDLSALLVLAVTGVLAVRALARESKS